MKAEAMNLLQWQARFGAEEACLAALKQKRWPEGFRCPKCGHDHGYWIAGRKLFQCGHCRHQTSVTAGTIFHSSNVPLVQWFLAVYLMASDKGGLSALRLSKQIGVSWITDHRMLRRMRRAMGDRDSLYRLEGLVLLDDAFVGGRRSGGKSGRGAEGKTPILVAVGTHRQGLSFRHIPMEIRQISAGISEQVRLLLQSPFLGTRTAAEIAQCLYGPYPRPTCC